MKYKILILLLVISSLVIAGCNSQQKTTNQDTTKTTAPTIPAEPTTSSGEVKEFTMTAKKWEFIPPTITVNKGDTVKLHIQSTDVAHGFGLSSFGVSERLEPGQTTNIEFVADKKGTFTFTCTVFCGSGHSGMKGQLIVQ